MTSVTEAAREAQISQFSDDETEAKQITMSIYDGIDAMDHRRKALLIRQALSAATVAVHQSAAHPEQAGLSGMMVGGLLAIAGYANETIREESGDTSTGDTAVDAVLDNFRLLVRTMAEAGMTPEQRAKADEAKRRIEAGEDPNKVLADVLASERAGSPGVNSQTTGSEESHGLYL